MYFIVNDYSTHVVCLSDVRNAKCGYTGSSYCIYIYFRNGSDEPATITFYGRERRDEVFKELCERLSGLEETT